MTKDTQYSKTPPLEKWSTRERTGLHQEQRLQVSPENSDDNMVSVDSLYLTKYNDGDEGPVQGAAPRDFERSATK